MEALSQACFEDGGAMMRKRGRKDREEWDRGEGEGEGEREGFLWWAEK